MSDPTPAPTRKTNGGLIAAGLLVVAGFVLIITQTGSHPTTDAAADAGSDAEPPQTFDLQEIPGFKAGVPLRPMDRDIFAALQDPKLTRERMQDLFPDRPYRVRVAGNLDEHRFAVVIVDLKRTGATDERWDLRGQVTRMVPHDPNADDGPVKYTLSHGRWQLH